MLTAAKYVPDARSTRAMLPSAPAVAIRCVPASYSAMGHTDESYAEPAFLQHLLEGIKWAAGVSAP
jgi:hypothetical protein